eukprot:3850180-Pleurochrysis_carterae.AAC.1
MAAWRSSAAAARERDRLQQEAHSASRRLECAEACCSQAQQWHLQGDANATARTKLNGMQTAYQSLQTDLRNEVELRTKREKEIAQLQAQIAKAN